jgi:hypothetical protein
MTAPDGACLVALNTLVIAIRSCVDGPGGHAGYVRRSRDSCLLAGGTAERAEGRRLFPEPRPVHHPRDAGCGNPGPDNQALRGRTGPSRPNPPDSLTRGESGPSRVRLCCPGDRLPQPPGRTNGCSNLLSDRVIGSAGVDRRRARRAIQVDILNRRSGASPKAQLTVTLGDLTGRRLRARSACLATAEVGFLTAQNEVFSNPAPQIPKVNEPVPRQ